MRSGWPRSRVMTVLAVAAFVVLLLVANPVGRALEWAGLSRGAIALIMLAAVLAIVLTLLLALRRRHGAEAHRAGREAAARLAQLPGWQPTAWQDDVPTVLRQRRLDEAQPIAVAAGTVTGRPATVAIWHRAFRNPGSALTLSLYHQVVVVDGLRPDAATALGAVSNPGSAGTRAISPLRWAGMPPDAVLAVAPEHRWGLGRAAMWPSRNVPEPTVWTDIAAELDALSGWLVLDGGRLEISASIDGSVPPQRLLALAETVISRAAL